MIVIQIRNIFIFFSFFLSYLHRKRKYLSKLLRLSYNLLFLDQGHVIEHEQKHVDINLGRV